MIFIRCIFPFLLSLLFFACTSPTPQPNVLFILTDDQGYGDLHLHGNDSLDTPVMDRLAGEGVRFDRFFVSPVCAPTRAALLSGRYPERSGAWWVTRGWENMAPSTYTLAEAFRDNGYATACYGKWHNGAHAPYDPLSQGFDRFFGFASGHWTNYFDTPLVSQDSLIETQGYISDLLTDSALAFMQKNREHPFFCYLPYNAPHSPFQVPDAYFDKYKTRGLSDKNAAVYGMVENLDDNLGRLLAGLDSLGLTDNTIVIFLSDNGPNGDRFNGGMKGRKGQVHEGGVRVPFFIRWPGKLPAGRVVDDPAAHIDLFPSLAELCGLDLAEAPTFDGRSLAPLLSGKQDSLADLMFFTHQCQGLQREAYPGAARDRRYRYELLAEGEEALYDMLDDPGQQHNLARVEPKRLTLMRNAYMAWYKEMSYEESPGGPVPVGYGETKQVYLPAHEAALSASLTYKAHPKGWAHDWITQWTDTSSRIEWSVRVERKGAYDFYLEYSCPPSDSGSIVALEVRGRSVTTQRLFTRIDRGFVPQLLPSPDRVPREQEAYAQTWGRLYLGRLTLAEGKQTLALQAAQIPGSQVAEVKGMKIEGVED